MTDGQQHALWAGAFCHYTGAGIQARDASIFCDTLIEAWPTLPNITRTLILERLAEYSKNAPFLWTKTQSRSWQQIHRRLIAAESAQAMREAILSELPGITPAIRRKEI